MFQRFLFYWIDTKPAGATVGGEYYLATAVFAHVAQALLTFFQLAFAGTQVALDPAAFNSMPVFCRDYAGVGDTHNLVNIQILLDRCHLWR